MANEAKLKFDGVLLLVLLSLFGGVAFAAKSANDIVAFSPKIGVLVDFVSHAGVAGELLFSVADDPNLNENPETGLTSFPFVLPPKMLGDPNIGAAGVVVWPNIDGLAMKENIKAVEKYYVYFENSDLLSVPNELFVCP